MTGTLPTSRVCAWWSRRGARTPHAARRTTLRTTDSHSTRRTPSFYSVGARDHERELSLCIDPMPRWGETSAAQGRLEPGDLVFVGALRQATPPSPCRREGRRPLRSCVLPHGAQRRVDVRITWPEPVAESRPEQFWSCRRRAAFHHGMRLVEKFRGVLRIRRAGREAGEGPEQRGRPLPAVARGVVESPCGPPGRMRAARMRFPAGKIEDAMPRGSEPRCPTDTRAARCRATHRRRADTPLRSADAGRASARRRWPPRG